MPSLDEIRAVVEKYVELMNAGDADPVAALYSPDGTLEDPVGGELRVGIEAIRKFYAASVGAVVLELSGPIRAAGNEAAFPMRGILGSGDKRSVIDIIDVMTFDEDARITSMRAFWSPDAIRPAS